MGSGPRSNTTGSPRRRRPAAPAAAVGLTAAGELLQALADDGRQGASRRAIEARGDAILADPQLTVPLGENGGGLTTPASSLPSTPAAGCGGLRDRLGAHELTENRRQAAGWERDALRDLAAGLPGPAVRAYDAHGRVAVTDSGLAARRAMVAGWWPTCSSTAPPARCWSRSATATGRP